MERIDFSSEWDEVAVSFGERVRTLREKRRLTQEQLAELTGLSRNQVQNIERSRNNTRDPETGRPGAGNPRLKTVFLLAAALDTDLRDLLDL